MEFGGRKRGNPDGNFGNGGGYKKSKQESEFSSGIGSKSKPCTKFFSTSGCQFGEGCHFLHFVPGGYSALAQMNQGRNQSNHHGRNSAPQPFVDGPAPAAKTKLCTKYNTAEGCKFGDKCRFAHGEFELGKPFIPSHEEPRSMGGPPMGHRLPGRAEPNPHGLAAAANFGASATAKISIDGSLAGAIIGKGGVNSKQICRMTGAKLSIKDHDSDPNQKNIELEGTFDQIGQASAMVRELIMSLGAGAASGPGRNYGGKPNQGGGGGGGGGPGSIYKTKMCENFAKGACTYGERCHFAHGANELRKPLA